MAEEEREHLFGSPELSLPTYQVISLCTRTFVSHLGRSLGIGAWRIENKNSPFGCWFSSFALGGDCSSSQLLPGPVCSLAPLGFRGASTEHYPFSLNILSKSASHSLAKSLGRWLINVSCPHSFHDREVAAARIQGQRGGREVSREGFITWSWS